MIDLKTATAIAKRFILPTLLALVVLGVPLGYQYYKLQKERHSLTALQANLEKKKTELEVKSASREAELDEKTKALGTKDAEIITMANQLKQSQALLTQRDQECQTALAKQQKTKIPVHQKAKPRPLKKAAIQQPKRAIEKRSESLDEEPSIIEQWP